MEPEKKNFRRGKKKTNVVDQLINIFDEEFFKPNIHGCRKCRFQRFLIAQFVVLADFTLAYCC